MINTTGKILSSHLQYVLSSIDARSSLPILTNVKINADEGGKVVLAGTDLQTYTEATFEAEKAERLSICAPAKRLQEIAKANPGPISLRLKDDGSLSPMMEIKAGRSRYTLHTQNADAYPDSGIERAGETIKVSLQSRDLLELLKCSTYAMASQDVRFFLVGANLMVKDGSVSVVSTNGHRLAIDTMGAEVKGEGQYLIPRASIIEIMRLLSVHESCELELGHVVSVSCGSFLLLAKLVDAKYPDWERAMPRCETNVTVDREGLRAAVQRLQFLTADGHKGVRMSVADGIMTLSVNNANQEDGVSTVEVEYSGEPVEMGMNIDYLADVLSTGLKGGRVMLGVRGGNSSMLCVDDVSQSRHVIMPMRL